MAEPLATQKEIDEAVAWAARSLELGRALPSERIILALACQVATLQAPQKRERDAS